MVPLVEPIRPLAASYPSAYPENIYGETPHTAMADQVTALAMQAASRDYLTIHSVVGESGQPLTVIEKNPTGLPTTGTSGQAYAATLFEAAAITRLAAAAGKTYGIGAIVMTHGESDAGNSAYADQLYQLLSDYNADLAEITGQTAKIPMLLSQQNSEPTDTGDVAVSALQQWQAGVEHPGEIVCTGPKYQYSYATDSAHVHLDPTGYDELGEKYGQVYFERVVLGHDWQPLQPISASVSGTVVTVQFPGAGTAAHLGRHPATAARGDDSRVGHGARLRGDRSRRAPDHHRRRDRRRRHGADHCPAGPDRFTGGGRLRGDRRGRDAAGASTRGLGQPPRLGSIRRHRHRIAATELLRRLSVDGRLSDQSFREVDMLRVTIMGLGLLGLGALAAAGCSSGGSDTMGTGGSSGNDSGTDAGTAVPPAGVVASGVRWFGRVDTSNAAGPRFSWSGTGFVAQLSGTGLSVDLSLTNSNEPYLFKAVVDGAPQPVFTVANGAGTYALATGLTAGPHPSSLYRQTEGPEGDATLTGITVEGGTLLDPAGRAGATHQGDRGLDHRRLRRSRGR